MVFTVALFPGLLFATEFLEILTLSLINIYFFLELPSSYSHHVRFSDIYIFSFIIQHFITYFKVISSLLLFNVWFQLTEFNSIRNCIEIMRSFWAICVVLDFQISVFKFFLFTTCPCSKVMLNVNPLGILVVINWQICPAFHRSVLWYRVTFVTCCGCRKGLGTALPSEFWARGMVSILLVTGIES